MHNLTTFITYFSTFYCTLISNYVIFTGELEVLLEASIRLGKAEVDSKCEPCQRFYREGLLTSFTKVRFKLVFK